MVISWEDVTHRLALVVYESLWLVTKYYWTSAEVVPIEVLFMENWTFILIHRREVITSERRRCCHYKRYAKRFVHTRPDDVSQTTLTLY